MTPNKNLKNCFSQDSKILRKECVDLVLKHNFSLREVKELGKSIKNQIPIHKF